MNLTQHCTYLDSNESLSIKSGYRKGKIDSHSDRMRVYHPSPARINRLGSLNRSLNLSSRNVSSFLNSLPPMKEWPICNPNSELSSEWRDEGPTPEHDLNRDYISIAQVV